MPDIIGNCYFGENPHQVHFFLQVFQIFFIMLSFLLFLLIVRCWCQPVPIISCLCKCSKKWQTYKKKLLKIKSRQIQKWLEELYNGTSHLLLTPFFSKNDPYLPLYSPFLQRDIGVSVSQNQFCQLLYSNISPGWRGGDSDTVGTYRQVIRTSQWQPIKDIYEVGKFLWTHLKVF